jgi:hypothetical protein
MEKSSDETRPKKTGYLGDEFFICRIAVIYGPVDHIFSENEK